jgi:hypothetical protein
MADHDTPPPPPALRRPCPSGVAGGRQPPSGDISVDKASRGEYGALSKSFLRLQPLVPEADLEVSTSSLPRTPLMQKKHVSLQPHFDQPALSVLPAHTRALVRPNC